MKAKKLIILSFDALGDIDSEIFEKLDGFKKMIDRGAYVKKVRSVYPSLTYPCHASIISGRYPKDTGIVNNLLLQPYKKNMDWYWYEKDIKGDTLFKAAKRKNLKTGAVLWPVSAKANIDYNIAEIIPHRPWHNQVMVSLLNSSPKLLIDLNNKYGHLRKGLSQPELDNFSEQCLHEIIRKYKPDLMACHFIGVDEWKHIYGTKSPKIEEAIGYYNDRINNILKLIEDLGQKDDTNLVVLSDHSQIDLEVGIRLNNYFKELGYIKEDSKGFVKKWQVIMQEAGGSCFIYSKDKSKDFLEKLRKEIDDFFEKNDFADKIYDNREIKLLGADKEAVFMIDGKRGYYFLQELGENTIEKDQIKHKASHGYSPDKENYQAVFFGLGPDFKNSCLEKAELIDLAPTLSYIMDYDLQGAKGRVLEELINF